jgi:hypothetical protein
MFWFFRSWRLLRGVHEFDELAMGTHQRPPIFRTPGIFPSSSQWNAARGVMPSTCPMPSAPQTSPMGSYFGRALGARGRLGLGSTAAVVVSVIVSVMSVTAKPLDGLRLQENAGGAVERSPGHPGLGSSLVLHQHGITPLVSIPLNRCTFTPRATEQLGLPTFVSRSYRQFSCTPSVGEPTCQ